MSEQVQRRRGTSEDAQAEAATAFTRTPQVQPLDVDAILDEIDAVLQSDAEDYVRGFVQKGGQ